MDLIAQANLELQQQLEAFRAQLDSTPEEPDTQLEALDAEVDRVLAYLED